VLLETWGKGGFENSELANAKALGKVEMLEEIIEMDAEDIAWREE